MQILTDDDAERWCGHHNLHVEGQLLSSLKYSVTAGRPFRIKVPDEATAIVALAYSLVLADTPGQQEDGFSGALLWLRRWEIWSETIDNAGYVLLNGVRSMSGDARDLGDAPGHLFAGHELVLAQACLALPMMFQWDARFVTGRGDFLAFVSHEGHIDFVPRTEQMRAVLLERFRASEPGELTEASRGFRTT